MGAARIDEKPQKSWIINSLFGVLIDPARLEPDEALRKSRIESYLAFVRAAKPQDEANPVLAPGDKERATRIERRARRHSARRRDLVADQSRRGEALRNRCRELLISGSHDESGRIQ
jgi:hypothetical protein